MFLYSKIDKLCTSDAIESYMENTRGHEVIKEKVEMDRQIFSECFSESFAHYLNIQLATKLHAKFSRPCVA